MSDLKVRIYKRGSPEPATTITIPGGVLRIARKLIPRRALAAMQAEGIDVEEIVRLSESPEAAGELARIEDHEKDEMVVLALEASG
jgi:hypothetical protein